MYPAFCKHIVHVSNCVSKVAQIYKNLPQNKCKINVVTLTVLLIVKEASCEAYEHKKNCLLLSRHQQEPHWPSKSYKAVSINLQKKDSLHINLSKLKVYSKFAETFVKNTCIIYLWNSFTV